MKKLIIFLLASVISLYGDSFSAGGSSGTVSPGALAYNATTQTVAAATTTQLTFNTNLYDTCASCTIHSTSVNPTRFTAPSAGYYLVQCTVSTTAANIDVFGNLLVNGSTPTPRLSNTTAAATTSDVGSITIIGVVKLNATDYVECSVFSAVGFTSVANGSAMSMTKLSTTLQ